MKNKLSLFLVGVMCFCIPLFAAAQTYVTGTVVDEQNEPLIGVNVVIKGTTTGTVTDFDGKFGLQAKAGSILVFSYLGYVSSELKAEMKRPMSIMLKEDRQALDEVVVIGYQDVRKRDLTGSVGKANMDDMLKAPVPSIDQALAGRVAGVNVSSGEGMPGSSMNIVIRGNNSVTQDNSPLFVVDGFPLEDSNIASTINPNDIESMDILKDASATAIYGSRGANGVVIITTKKGIVGKPTITYDGSVGTQRAIRTIPMMNAYEFVRLQSEILTTSEIQASTSYFPLVGDLRTENPNGIPNTYFAGILAGKSDDYRVTLDDYINCEQYDWQDMILRTAIQQNHSISLTGGTTDARYNASLSYYDQDGVVLESNYNRIQGRLGTNIKKNKLSINLTTNYSRATTTGSSPSQSSWSGMNNLFYSVWGYRPTTQPSKSINSLVDNTLDDDVSTTNDYRFNPVMSLKNEYKKTYNTYAQFSGVLEYEFIKGLKLKVSGGYTINDKKTEQFNNSNTRYGSPTSNDKVNATFGSYERKTWLNENYLTYQKNIKKYHNLSAMVGMSLQASNYKYYAMKTTQIPYESLGMAGMDNGTANTVNSGERDWSMMSYYGRFNYNYKSKYYVNATFRADGSSKMAEGHKFGYFPSGSLAWTFTEEKFLEPITRVISNGKLRASWGQTGNNRVGEYDAYAQLYQLKSTSSGISSGVYGYGGTVTNVGTVPTGLANKNLKWETTTQTNVGLDASFVRDRISLTVDWYNKVTNDLLLSAELAPSTGYPTATKNIGSVQNRGWEFTLNTTNIKRKHFTWTTNFNISFNKNKVLELAENQRSMLTTASFSQGYTSNYIAIVGQPLGLMYGYIYEGTYKYDDFDYDGSTYTLKSGVPYYTSENNTQPGYPKYADLNKDGVIDSNDMTIIGNGNPVHIGGFTNNFEFYGVDVSIFFQWSCGNNIMNANKLFFETGSKTKELNKYASYVNRWTPQNPDSDIPCVSNSSSNNVISSRIIEDGSYLRLKTLSIGYTIDPNITKKAHISKARIYVSGQNLWTLTKYSGYDPEVSVRNSALTPGLDFSSYPRAMSFNVGVNVSF